MKVSVLIPTHNDTDYIDQVINALLWDSPYWYPDEVDLEIIVINDGSVAANGTSLSMKTWFNYFGGKVGVIENSQNFGVGYSFDRGAEIATGDILILTACDILVKGGHVLRDVIDAVQSHPNEIGCCTTLGLSPDNLDLNHPDKVYYGANLLWTYEGYKEELKSKLLRTDGHYNSILNGQWNFTLESITPFKISCLMGGFYFCTKELYVKMYGFDTYKGERFRGHMKWGHLEPMLSLKAEMYGDGCRLYPNIEVGHVFGRKTEGARSAEYQYWNALWIAHTMLDKDLRDELLDFIKPNFQYGIAQQWVKQHKDVIYEVRERNHREGKLIKRL